MSDSPVQNGELAFPTLMRVACEEALDKGIFYDDEFTPFVRERCQEYDPARNVLAGKFYPEDIPVGAAIRNHIATRSRGTWALMYYKVQNRGWWRACMSDGTGKIARGGSSDSHETCPTYEQVYQRMVDREIYVMRHEIQAERTLENNRKAIEENGFKVGDVFHKLTIGWKNFSTVTITGVNREKGTVDLFMIKRGSSNRFTTTINATGLVNAIRG